MRIRLFPTLALSCLAALCLAAFSMSAAASAAAQDSKQKAAADAPKTSAAKADERAAPKIDEKAVAVVEHAVEAMGGRAYLDVRAVVSHGYFTLLNEKTGGLPVAFRDYTVFPDRERTEFKGAGVKRVEVYAGAAGWVYDARAKNLTDIKPEQHEDFRTATRTSIDNVLRGWWRSEGATLSYLGRREAGLARRNETVGLTYPDGFSVEFEFDAKEWLPAKAKYRKQNAEGELLEEEDRYAQFQSIGAVRVPFIVDHYRAGVQSSRVNYDAVEFNAQVPDSLFTKPADIKAIKF